VWVFRKSLSKSINFHVKTITIDTEDEGPLRVKLQIWDTGGQERFSSIRPMYYRGSLGALLIFDLTSYESFEHLPQWIEEVRANIKSEVPLLLVGNKSDLVEERMVSIEEINSFTRKFNLYYMETSAKTGEGVGDCFYILACLMVGSGVPDQLVFKGIVFSPGEVLNAVSSPSAEISPLIEPEIDISSPSKPEPSPILEPEPEIEFAAPPVPEPTFVKESKPSPILEPEPEIEFAAPPVPKPSTAKLFTSETTIEQEVPVPEPKIEKPIKQLGEFEFKTPDEILSQEIKKQQQSDFITTPKVSISSDIPAYKPKAIPFSSNIPIPAQPPQEFQSSESDSYSLVDYMPETILSKKEKKKLEKQRKKEEKEKTKLEKEKKLLEKRERAAKLKAEMQAVGKEQKIKPKKEKKQKFEEFEPMPEIPFQTKISKDEESESPSLFQTLTEKTKESTQAQVAPFMQFTATDKSAATETSNLRIIPNVADIDNESFNVPEIPSEPTIPYIASESANQKQAQAQHKKELVICSHCGAMLSSDYAFCNKCGAKL
jgi:small GTP-binding protein